MSADIPASQILAIKKRNAITNLILLGVGVLVVVYVLPVSMKMPAGWVITALVGISLLMVIFNSIVMPVIVGVVAAKERNNMSDAQRAEMKTMNIASAVELVKGIAAFAMWLWMWRSIPM